MSRFNAILNVFNPSIITYFIGIRECAITSVPVLYGGSMYAILISKFSKEFNPVFMIAKLSPTETNENLKFDYLFVGIYQ